MYLRPPGRADDWDEIKKDVEKNADEIRKNGGR